MKHLNSCTEPRSAEEIETLMADHCPWYRRPKSKWTAEEKQKEPIMRLALEDRSATINGQVIAEYPRLAEPKSEGLTSRNNHPQPVVFSEVIDFLAIPENQKPNLIANLEDSITMRGEIPSVYVWQGKIIACELDYEVAERMKAKSNLVLLDFDCIEGAKAFRLEKMISSQIQLSTFSRIEAVLPLREYFKRIGKKKMSNGGRLKESVGQKHDTATLLAQKAQTSRTNVIRAMNVIKAYKDKPEAGEQVFISLRNDEKTLSSADSDVKGTKYRNKQNKKEHTHTNPTIIKGVRTEIDLDCLAPQVVCGNSLDLLSTLPDHVLSGMVFGSPPYYGVNYDYGHNFSQFASLEDWSKWMDDYNKQFARILKHNGSRVAWQVANTWKDGILNDLALEIKLSARRHGLIPFREIVVAQSQISGKKMRVGSSEDPVIRPNHELILPFFMGTKKLEGERNIPEKLALDLRMSTWDDSFKTFARIPKYFGDYWRMCLTGKDDKHPCPFNLIVPYAALGLFTGVGDDVIDPWGGVGTTGVAGALLGRRVIVIDQNPEYCATALKRINDAVEHRSKYLDVLQARMDALMAQFSDVDADTGQTAQQDGTAAF